MEHFWVEARRRRDVGVVPKSGHVAADPEFLTTRQVAQELSVSKTVVVSLVRNGALPARRVSNGCLMFERGILERWIQGQDAETRRWVLDHEGCHGDWREWPIGRADDDRLTRALVRQNELTASRRPRALIGRSRRRWYERVATVTENASGTRRDGPLCGALQDHET